MKDLTPKFDDTAGAAGQLTADEFNDFANEVQTAITESGQTLTGGVGENNRQLAMAILSGGKRISRGDGETALIGEIVSPDNDVAPITINLPSTGLYIGAAVVFEAVFNQLYRVNSLTLGRNGNNIMSLAEDLTMNSRKSNNTKVLCVWRGAGFGWEISVIGVIGSTL